MEFPFKIFRALKEINRRFYFTTIPKLKFRSVNSNISLRQVHNWSYFRNAQFFNRALNMCGCSLLSFGVYYVYDKNWSKFVIKAAQPVDPPPIKDNKEVNVQKVRNSMNFIADIVEKVAPAVVFIEIVGSQQTFYGKEKFKSHGSGFIVKSDGLILTNLHVVQGSSKLKVTLFDGRKFDGYVENYDSSTDLATIRINAKNLPVLKLAKSKNARAGEFVIAVGSPLALNNSVTLGVISNTQRELDFEGPFNGRKTRYIQTDAPITFGNSGGPLINLDGEAVGINNMTLDGAPGISFAIPSDYATEFLEKLEKKPSKSTYLPLFKRRHLGATMLTLDPEIITTLKFFKFVQFDMPDVDHGVLVHTIEWGSVAHKSGLQPGDIITHINDEPLHSSEQLLEILQNEKINQLNLTVLRDWTKGKLTVVLDS